MLAAVYLVECLPGWYARAEQVLSRASNHPIDVVTDFVLRAFREIRVRNLFVCLEREKHTRSVATNAQCHIALHRIGDTLAHSFATPIYIIEQRVTLNMNFYHLKYWRLFPLLYI